MERQQFAEESNERVESGRLAETSAAVAGTREISVPALLCRRLSSAGAGNGSPSFLQRGSLELPQYQPPRRGLRVLASRAERPHRANQSLLIQKQQKAPSAWDGASVLCRRSPNLPHTYACSTIGPTRLNFRVRDGNGCDPRSKLTGKLSKSRSRDLSKLNRLGLDVLLYSNIKV